jgi:hypothetical protein
VAPRPGNFLLPSGRPLTKLRPHFRRETGLACPGLTP